MPTVLDKMHLDHRACLEQAREFNVEINRSAWRAAFKSVKPELERLLSSSTEQTDLRSKVNG